MKKVKRHGQLKLEDRLNVNVQADVLLHGYLEGYYADTQTWIGVSTNNRMNFNPTTWKQFKNKVDNMFNEVKKERNMK